MPKRSNPSPSRLIASVHRFRDKVGAYISDDGGTAYLSPKEARDIAAKLVAAADSIEREAFVDSPAIGLTINADGRYD